MAPTTADTETSTAEIRNLWPTAFGRATLDDHEAADRALLALAAAGPPPGDLFAVDDPAVGWLAERARGAVGAWFDGVGAPRPRRWRLSGRLDVVGFCDYRELGNDAGAHLAGLYFVNDAPAPELDHVRSDCDPSCVSFFDPRVGFNALAVEGDPYYSQVFHARPRAGTLLLWPGYVRHITRVHLAREPWVIARFRVHVDASADGGPGW